MENEERFLPIGTVVILKGGKRELMIMSYCIMPSGDVYDKSGKIDAKGKMYDYGACFYPEGMVTSDQLFAFNHDQIEKICFRHQTPAAAYPERHRPRSGIQRGACHAPH